VGIVAAQPPSRWLLGATGRGTARWTEDGAGLTYRGRAAFGWAVLPETSLRDGFVQVRFKPIAGREDQAGGVCALARRRTTTMSPAPNALETTWSPTSGGRAPYPPRPRGNARRHLRRQTKVAGALGHAARRLSGSEFTVVFDGQRLFSVRDGTFAEAGKVGIWSKADSVTEFERPQWSKS